MPKGATDLGRDRRGHRATQRRALLRAAAGLVESGSVAAVTPTAVAERAGMAHTSVYGYFDTREDLLVAVAIDAFEVEP